MRNFWRAIDTLESVKIQGVEQWVLIRGENAANPVLLLIQAGPGLPMIPEADRLNKALKLESQFTVVYWDTRGCGKSYSGNIPRASMTLDQLVTDAHEMSEFLKRRLSAQRITIAGFSMGGTIALLAGARHPENYSAVVAIGPDILGDEAGAFAYDFALNEARLRRNQRAILELEKIGPAPHDTPERFSTRVKWVANFGGIERNASYPAIFKRTFWSFITNPHYSLADVIRSVKGISFAQASMVEEMATWNLFARIRTYSLPLYVFQGAWDKATRPETVREFVDSLPSSGPKQFVLFESSAHAPQWEESERFALELMKVKNAQ